MSVLNNPEIVKEVLYEWTRLKRSPYKVAAAVGIGVREVLTIIDDHGHTISEIVERHDGEGRPELREFVVARKLVTERWDNDSAEVAKARWDYEAGLIEMATGRDGRWLLLYAFPRKRPAPRPDYFKPEVSL